MKQNTRRAAIAGAAMTAVLLLLTAGSCEGDNQGDQAEKDFTEKAQRAYNISQPPHQYDASQARENLIAAHDAMALGADSWTVQTIPGVGVTFQCPSRGLPVPYSAQLTNPQKIDYSRYGNVTLPQMEPYGLYAPEGVAATFANCVLPNGQIGIFYSEPDLTTFLFDVDCDRATNQCSISKDAKATVNVPKVDPKRVNVRRGNVTEPNAPEDSESK